MWVKKNKTHRLILEEIKPNGNVLDLGCNQCAMWEGESVGLVGIDIDGETLKLAKQHYPYGIYIQGDAKNTGLPDKQFDFVIMCGLLDYFEDWSSIIKEAKRLSRGKIFITLLQDFRNHNWTSEAVERHLGYKPIREKWINSKWLLLEI